MSDKVENIVCDNEEVASANADSSVDTTKHPEKDTTVPEKEQDDKMECDTMVENDKKIELNEKDVPETREGAIEEEQDEKMQLDTMVEKDEKTEPGEKDSVPETQDVVDKEQSEKKEPSIMDKEIESNEGIVKATIPDEEQMAVKAVETEKFTENKDLENISAQDTEESNVSEKTNDVTADDANESQESMELVIDEKNDQLEADKLSTEKTQEIKEDDKPEDEKPEEDKSLVEKDKDSAGPAKETELKGGEKNSCKDSSEISVPTQTDLTEVSSVVTEKNDEKNPIDKKITLVSAEDIAKNIIEIDDEPEEDAAKEKDAQKPEDDCTEVPQTSAMEAVIEIDDDDEEDEEKPVADETSSTVETLKKSARDNDGDAKAGATELQVDDPVDVMEKQPAMPTDDKDVESKASSESVPEAVTETGKPDEIVLEETKSKPASPSPVAVEANLAVATDEVFYNKECLNYECPRNHKQYFRVSQFILSYFKVAKKKFKPQYVCGECHDKALDMYEEFCGVLDTKQPLLLRDIVGGRQEFVEIIDSSDEEDTDDKADKDKESPSFSKADLDLIEKELENSIRTVLDKVEIQNQLTWSKTILATRVKKLEEETNYIDAELRSLQKKADNMHVSLYQCPKIKIRQLQPLDLNSGRPYATGDTELPQLPPVGEIHRPPIQIGESYFAVKNKAIASWVPCKVTEQVADHISQMMAQKNLKHYKIKFLKSQYQMLKTVSVKHLAYYNPPPVRLPIATRVIAYFDATSLSRGKEKMMIQSAFYPGIIAEPLKPNNKYRYLIFYDDGYTQYVYHKDVRLVCHVSENVWEDVHPGSRDFIQKYLTQYSINRPMVQTQKGQSMTTESNGKWIYARVVDIDCSLIQMQFEGPKSHTEWIYRGSMRLGPVFKEYQKTLQKDAMPISRLPRRTEPFIRYTEDEEATSNQQNERTSEARAVAKKSVSRPDSSTSSLPPPQTAPVKTVRHLNNSTIYVEDENKPKGKVVYYTAKRNLNPRTYTPHKCSSACLFQITHNLSAYSPLSKPLLSGWERLIMRQKVKKIITYRSPCGLILRNMKELHKYLRNTRNSLNVDNFDFSHETNCLAEYVIESVIVQKRDISLGQEKMPIPLVNYYDSTMPPECTYAAQRIPTEGVNLNLDEEFMVGCDCEDDCSDKSKCSCWQLTQNGAKYGNPNTPTNEIGYQYKRLYEHVPTGIYECNSRCKCKSNCLNRVVQQSLQMKLQVFKTSNRGWGLRCLNDVPRGSFICIYAGHLLTEAKANEGGLDAGDEYFAELDYIEVAEQIKEGYESDVDPPEPEEEEEDLYAPDQDDDDEFTPSKSFITRARNKSKVTRHNPPQNGDDDSQERQVINFNPNADMNENSMRESSIRQLFGKDEACYVMDAKTIGNLGRYFNHSCSPNLFVQNVFVDTHDLRFPWVAFFALSHIRSGTELTWNYNYEVGVVPGKVLYCQCGAPNCRLRLL